MGHMMAIAICLLCWVSCSHVLLSLLTSRVCFCSHPTHSFTSYYNYFVYPIVVRGGVNTPLGIKDYPYGTPPHASAPAIVVGQRKLITE